MNHITPASQVRPTPVPSIKPTYVRLISDMHLEFCVGNPNRVLKLAKIVTELLPSSDLDRQTILVLAGDNSSHPAQLDLLLAVCAPRFMHVVILNGNHEHYGHEIKEWNERAYAWERTFPNVSVSRINEVMEARFNSCNVIFHTLWTDPFDGGKYIPPTGFPDFNYIKNGSEYLPEGHKKNVKLSPEDCRDMFFAAKKQIFAKLEERAGETNIVVTHHCPLASLMDPSYNLDNWSALFLGDCAPELNAKKYDIKYWLFGHTHYPVNKILGGIHFVNNPVGYPNEKSFPQNTPYGTYLI